MDPGADPLTRRVVVLPGITIPILLFLCIALAVYYSCKKQYIKQRTMKDQKGTSGDKEEDDETELMGEKTEENTKPIIVATYKKRGSEGFEQVSINISPPEKSDSESDEDENEQHFNSQQISQSVIDED